MLITLLFANNTIGSAQTWQPVGATQIPIWPTAAPDSQPVPGPEIAKLKPGKALGSHWTEVENVTVPTLTRFAPKGHNTGAAVLVFPGGGYQILAIDTEGTELCDLLTEQGITCFVLKYRVTTAGPYPYSGPYPESPMALEDAQRALGLVRFHAAEWAIDPHKIGVIGFSAGGHLVAALSTHFKTRIYTPIDAADQLSCRPDFAAPIYPGHMHLKNAIDDAKKGKSSYKFPAQLLKADADLTLNPELPVAADAPPTFLLQNEDDNVDSVYDALSYYIALKKAGVKAEMHLYAEGGHAFGVRPTKLAVSVWPALLQRWLRSIGIITV